MSIHAEVLTIDDTATLVTTGGHHVHDKKTVYLRGVTATIYLGPSGVTTATGFPLAADESIVIELGPHDSLYAVTATTADVNVLVCRNA